MKTILPQSDWYRHLKYEEVPVNAASDDTAYGLSYVDAGHIPETLRLERCNLDIDNENIAFIDRQYTFLKNRTYCVHRLRPGRYIPTHCDHYAYFKKKYNIQDTNKITRYIVFLETYQDGHILVISNDFISRYEAGYTVKWQGTTSHAALNFGLTNRYTLQITGLLND